MLLYKFKNCEYNRHPVAYRELRGMSQKDGYQAASRILGGRGCELVLKTRLDRLDRLG